MFWPAHMFEAVHITSPIAVSCYVFYKLSYIAATQLNASCIILSSSLAGHLNRLNSIYVAIKE